MRALLLLLLLVGCSDDLNSDPPDMKAVPTIQIPDRICNWSGCVEAGVAATDYITDLVTKKDQFPGQVVSGDLCSEGSQQVTYIRVNADFMVEINYYKDGKKFGAWSYYDEWDATCQGQRYTGSPLPDFCCK